VTLKAPFKGRDNDVAGIAVGYAKIGSHAQSLQYAFRPSGGIPNPENPSQRVGNEAVVGLRTNIIF